MSEDALQVELPKATGEASGSRGQRRGGRRAPPIPRLNPPQRANPAPGIAVARLPQPQQDRPYLVHPARAIQHPQEAQEVLQQPVEDARRHPEDNWVHLRRLVQQRRVLAGRFAGNRGGGARMDPGDRGRVDEWRRGVPDGAVI